MYIQEDRYDQNMTTEESLEYGWTLIKEAAEQSDVDAMSDLGYYYDHGLPQNE